jgi:hypothetical protein
MKKNLLLLLLAPLALFAASSGTKIPLAEGRWVFINVPETWTAAALPAPPGDPAISTTVHYVTRNGSNDSVVITFVNVPDDRLESPEALQTLVEESSQQFVAGSVEGKIILKPLQIGVRKGFAVTFTDASLVGKPAVKDDFKVMTSCFVYLGSRTFVTATVFTDELNGKACAEALRLLQSIAVADAKNAL